MEQNFMESLKGKSREERLKILESYKKTLADSELKAVNGGETEEDTENPNSTICPYAGKWISSLGYICRGTREC